jgi:hypothetical protein
VNLIALDREPGLGDSGKYQHSAVRWHHKAGGRYIYGTCLRLQTPAEEVIQGTIPVNWILSFRGIDG